MRIALKRYGFSDDDPIDTWLNWGMHDLEREHNWPFLNEYGLSTHVIGEKYSTQKFFANKHVITIRVVGYEEPMTSYSMQQYLREISRPDKPGRPEVFTIVGAGDVLWYPVPDQAYTFEYFAKLKENDLVNPGDTPDFIPDDLHAAIVLRGVVYGLQAENEEDRATDALNQYNTLIAKAISDRSGAVRGPHYVQDVSHYNG